MEGGLSRNFIVHTYAKGAYLGRSFSFRAKSCASCSEWIDTLHHHMVLAKRNSSKIEWYKKYQVPMQNLNRDFNYRFLKPHNRSRYWKW